MNVLLEFKTEHQESRSLKTSACLCGCRIASCGTQGNAISHYVAAHGSVRTLAGPRGLQGLWQVEQILSFLKITAPWPCCSFTPILSRWTKILLVAATHSPLITQSLSIGSASSPVPAGKAEMPRPPTGERLRCALLSTRIILDLEDISMHLKLSTCLSVLLNQSLSAYFRLIHCTLFKLLIKCLGNFNIGFYCSKYFNFFL